MGSRLVVYCGDRKQTAVKEIRNGRASEVSGHDAPEFWSTEASDNEVISFVRRWDLVRRQY